MKPGNTSRLLWLAALVASLGACAGVIGIDDFTYDGAGGGTGGAGGGSSGDGGVQCEPGVTKACYSGPPGTQDKGPCRAGTATCNAAGTAFGPCEGQVVPSPETCATKDVDDDCDGSTDCPGMHLWSKQFGATGADVGRGVAADPDGNVIVAGYFYGAGMIDKIPVPTIGYNDILLAKFDPSGKYLWSRRYGTGSSSIADKAQAVAVDAEGSVFATGFFAGGNNAMVDLGGGAMVPSIGGEDAFVVKLDKDGNLVWIRSFVGPGDQEGRGIAIDAAGDVLVTGSFEQTIDFGGGTATSAGSLDAFVVMLDKSGAFLWGHGYGTTSDQTGESIAVDAAGNAVITGSFVKSIDFGAGGPPGSGCGTAMTSAGLADIFVARLDPKGDCLLQRRWGDAKLQEGHAIAAAAPGDLLFAGKLEGAVDFGAGVKLASTGGSVAFGVRLDGQGQPLWGQHYGDPSSTKLLQDAQAVAVAPGGELLIAGFFQGLIDLGGGPVASNTSNEEDAFLVKRDAAGKLLWGKTFGGTGVDKAHAVATDAKGNVFVTGECEGDVDFGGGVLLCTSSANIFLAKYAP